MWAWRLVLVLTRNGFFNNEGTFKFIYNDLSYAF